MNKPGMFLQVVIEGTPGLAGVIHLAKRNEVPHPALHPDALDTSVIDQAKQWLKDCANDHVGECDNLSFSADKPRFLIEILSPETIQLREGRNIQPYPARPIGL
ncbi:hypothetical protein E8E12_002595 [Didymella heteroderae]|uniref:Uncharacterized protein n=1 Tax=Didymella heteroderae TaxID=1769908 RepID=A0A9P4WZV8_9PLEO|nr:hypothetical protein E8E12_002595 [Didymella heteroderae]